MTAGTIERFDILIVDLPTIRPHKLAMLEGIRLCSTGIDKNR